MPQPAGFPKYCPDCGHQLDRRRIEGRIRAYCPACEQPVYRNAKPCAGVVVVEETRVLLVKRTTPPAVGSWSLPAGFLEVDEPPATAARRELQEETGLVVAEPDLTLFDTTLVARTDGTRVLVLVYTADRTATTGTVRAGSDAADVRFWRLETLRKRGECLEPGYEAIFRRAIASETDMEATGE